MVRGAALFSRNDIIRLLSLFLKHLPINASSEGNCNRDLETQPDERHYDQHDHNTRVAEGFYAYQECC